MSQKQQIDTPQDTSQLQQFELGFEFDKTWQDVKKDVHQRTYK